MYIVEELKKCMKEAGEGSTYCGYFYSIEDVLTISVSGMLCGIEKAKYIWEWANEEPVKQFLKETFKIEQIPCYAQYMNILGIISPERFNLCFVKWVQSILNKGVEGKTVTIDGKTICSTGRLSSSGEILHIASALLSETGLVIGSRSCGTKTGEITAFRELLELLDVKGAIIVADALHCNKKSAEAVLEANADYLFVVKDNQPILKENIELYFAQPPCELDKYSTIEKNGGRIEKRT
ncbi:ISAs1 family transposase, partial [Christensenellaceae bacterium OttesenSCG-928-M15]|nr:ISAs1 family transposase [Christensenellaceae bacterium OttesenSCG-928-M15]